MLWCVGISFLICYQETFSNPYLFEHTSCAWVHLINKYYSVCRWSSLSVTIYSVALAYNGTWSFGIGNALDVVRRSGKVTLEMFTSEEVQGRLFNFATTLEFLTTALDFPAY